MSDGPWMTAQKIESQYGISAAAIEKEHQGGRLDASRMGRSLVYDVRAVFTVCSKKNGPYVHKPREGGHGQEGK